MNRIQLGEALMSVWAGWARTDKQTEGTNRNERRCRLALLLGSFLLTMAVLTPSTGHAALVTYEGFDYNVYSLDGQYGGTGWSTYWNQFFSPNLNYVVTNGSLAFGALNTSSNSVSTTGAAGFVGRFFTSPGNWAQPGVTNYWSVLIRPNVTPATNHFYGLQLFSNDNNTGNGVDLFVGKNGDGPNWGLQAGVGTDAFSSVAAQLNQTVLLVVRCVFAEGSPDSFVLYVNPTPGGPEPATPDAAMMDDIGTQDGIALNTGNGGQASFDEIRIGSTFASVTSTSSIPDPNLIAYEGFAYNQNTLQDTLDAQPGDGSQGSNGWDNVTWDQFLGSGGTNFNIIAGSLSDPSGKLVTSGNSVQAVTPQTTYQAFTGRFNVWTASSGNTNANPTYYSVLIRPDNLGLSNGAAFFQIFGQPSGNDLYAGYLFGSPYWGFQNESTQVLSSVSVVSNQTTFLVVRANYAPAGSPSTFLLYVNPTPGASEPATANATYSLTQSSQQNGIALQVQNGAAATFDEIRVGTNYADVTPAVPVAGPFNITSVAIAGTNVVLTWTTTGGNTNVVQATPGSSGSYNTNGFVNISGQMIIAGSGGVTTNYTDVGGATDRPSRYYRIQQLAP